MQLCGTGGEVGLVDMEQGCRTTLSFDPAVFPCVLLWIANRGRASYPWRNRFCAVGIEPVRAAFDLGVDVSCDPGNPIAKAGYPTALELAAGEVFSTSYRIEATSPLVNALAGQHLHRGEAVAARALAVLFAGLEPNGVIADRRVHAKEPDSDLGALGLFRKAVLDAQIFSSLY